jgi:hypothetical protein
MQAVVVPRRRVRRQHLRRAPGSASAGARAADSGIASLTVPYRDGSVAGAGRRDRSWARRRARNRLRLEITSARCR